MFHGFSFRHFFVFGGELLVKNSISLLGGNLLWYFWDAIAVQLLKILDPSKP